MSLTQSLELANELKLAGLAGALERRIAEYQSNPGDVSDFIRLLLEDERMSRHERTTTRLISRARFRRHCQLEDWDQSYDRGLSCGSLKELGLLTFYHNRENLILIGNTGSGKTHLAIALGHRLCHQGVPISFYSTNLLLEELAAQKAAGKYLLAIKALSRLGALVLDDFGLRKYTHDEAMALMDLLEERYRKGSLILTSQVKPDGWKTLFEDPVTAEALIDRLRSPSVIVHLKGPSYRDKHNLSDRKVKNGKPE